MRYLHKIIRRYGFADSTVLAHVLTLLNKRHDYGLDLFLLSIDEGIAGYRDDSLETVKRNETQVCTSTVSLSFSAENIVNWVCLVA